MVTRLLSGSCDGLVGGLHRLAGGGFLGGGGGAAARGEDGVSAARMGCVGGIAGGAGCKGSDGDAVDMSVIKAPSNGSDGVESPLLGGVYFVGVDGEGM